MPRKKKDILDVDLTEKAPPKKKKKKKAAKIYTPTNLTTKQKENLNKLPQPKLTYAQYQKKTGKQSRRQYNNYRAKQAGFKDYATWQKARKHLGASVGSKAKKGEKKVKKDKHGGKAYKFDWRDENIESNLQKLQALLESQDRGMGAQFVVLANTYQMDAKSLKEFSYAKTYSFPIRGSQGWLTGKRMHGMNFDEYFREEFNITPYQGSKVYHNGIKTVWVYIQKQKE